MRLLNAYTLELESFLDDIPPYAILSHCWNEDEVLYSEISDLERVKDKKGFTKIQKTCERARGDGLNYCWVDTCCIDKRSSAELSEAINSMFAWYKNSARCYAYLADVDDAGNFERSKWFTRAWTLQELLAPSVVTNNKDINLAHSQAREEPARVSGMDFFTKTWTRLGSKNGLSAAIAGITGIPKEYLEGKSLESASISMRMSWAAYREATRGEDIAYSLLGLFDVNLPLLYGEGKLKAFRRLQEEIMRISEDQTLLSWESSEVGNATSTDVLATDPRDFTEARDLIPFTSDVPIAPYSMTHRGLRIWLQLFHPSGSMSGIYDDVRPWVRPIRAPVMIFSSEDNLVWSPLLCHVAYDYQNIVMIPLRRLSADTYIRDTSTSVALVPTAKLAIETPYEEVFIRHSRVLFTSDNTPRQFGILIRQIPPGFTVTNVVPDGAWDPRSNILLGESYAADHRFWHASLQLSFSHAIHTNPSLFISLGCKKASVPSERLPWCFIDNFVYTHEDVSLVNFHDFVSNFEDQRCVAQPRDCEDVQYDFELSIRMSLERVFGQTMFVVDIERSEIEGDIKGAVNLAGNLRNKAQTKLETGLKTSFLRGLRRSISSGSIEQ